MAESTSPDDDQELLDPDLHLVIPEIVAAAGGANILQAQYELNAGYQNMDESGIKKTPSTRLWLEVNAEGTGDPKTFQVSYAVVPTESLS